MTAPHRPARCALLAHRTKGRWAGETACDRIFAARTLGHRLSPTPGRALFYGAGCVTAFWLRVTEVCAKSRPFTDAPVPKTMAV